MDSVGILGYFSIGFFCGFGHCIAMCHPFVLYISGRFVGDKKGYRPLFAPHILYNFGRIFTYTALGAAAGLAGDFLTFTGNFMGIQKASGILAGAFLLIYGSLLLFGFDLMVRLESKTFSGRIMNVIKKIQPKGPFLTGLILGFIPCGPLYGALIGASASGSAPVGAAMMFMFGAGTLSAMLLAAVFGNFIMKKRGLFRFLSGALLAGMGVWFIYASFTF